MHAGTTLAPAEPRRSFAGLLPFFALASLLAGCASPADDVASSDQAIASGVDPGEPEQPEPPATCTGGHTATSRTFRASTNGMECAEEKLHCVTDDERACPMLAPIPPWWCADGTRVYEPGFGPSSDGKECSLPSVHCVTKDERACPRPAPLPPGWCPNGTRVAQPRFIPSADGKECSLPSIHCVTEAADACVAYPDP